MTYKQKIKRIVLHEGYYQVTPIKPINKDASRFAYKLSDVKGYDYKGLYELESINASEKTHTYKKLKDKN